MSFPGIFKACDIRGVVGDEWNAQDAFRIGYSLGHMLLRRNETSICVGGDFRRSTPDLKQTLIGGLVEAGVNVTDFGHVPTPVVYFGARHLNCPNVAIVTASHNPGRYNGIKFMVSGRPATPELISELKEGVDDRPGTALPGVLQSVEIAPLWERRVVEEARCFAKPTARFPDSRVALSVAVDAMAGAFTHLAPRVLQSAGHSVTALSQHIDPDFLSLAPNPADDKNLGPLIEHVTRTEADVGVALDGDGDRVVFVDHTGGIIRPEQVAVLFIQQCSRQPVVVYDLKCASVVSRAALAAGGDAIMQPSGHGFIKTTMIDQLADLGVEVSGHHFFRILDGGDDGLFTALVLLELMQKTGRSLADLIQPIGWPAITPDVRIPCAGDAAALVERIGVNCGCQVTRMDGVRAEYEDGWALARASITEPAITLRFEGRDEQHQREIVERFLASVPELRSSVMERLFAEVSD